MTTTPHDVIAEAMETIAAAKHAEGRSGTKSLRLGAFGAAVIAPALLGQLIGKGYATVAYLIIGKAVAGAVLRQPHQQQEGA